MRCGVNSTYLGRKLLIDITNANVQTLMKRFDGVVSSVCVVVRLVHAHQVYIFLSCGDKHMFVREASFSMSLIQQTGDNGRQGEYLPPY